MRKKLTGYTLAVPMILGFTLFYVIPACIMVWYSISFGIGKREYVGLDNFMELLENEMFLLALKNTFRFLVICVPAIIIISLIIALLLQKISGHSMVLKTVYFYPMLMPIASIVLLVRTIWGEHLQSAKVFGVLCLLYLWKFFGYHVLIFFARLQMIPHTYYDCAELNGASGWGKFRYIALPLIFPVIGFNVVLAIMNAFKCYREAFLLGGEYPDESIYLLQHFMNNHFQNLNYQRISAAAVMILFVFCSVSLIIWGFYKIVRRRSNA